LFNHVFKDMNFRLAIGLVILGSLFRFFPLVFPVLHNFSPVGALCLFGAAYFSRTQKGMLLIPLVVLFVSDLILNNVFYAAYYDGFTWMSSPVLYAAHLAVMALGWLMLSKKVTPGGVLAASVMGGLLFFLISNFNVWYGAGSLYPQTPEGFVACYTAALPFLKNTLVSNVLFSSLMFGVYEWAASKEKRAAMVEL
jgi:hypothetical protein